MRPSRLLLLTTSVALGCAVATLVSAAEQAREPQVWLDAALLRTPSKVPAEMSFGEHEWPVRQPPFSFIYDGQPSAKLLPTWKKSIGEPKTAAGKTRRDVTYTDPKTGLEIVCELTQFADFPAVEWVLRLTNRGTADTPIVESVLPLDLGIALQENYEPVLHHSKGSVLSPDDFIPYRKTLGKTDAVKFPEGKIYSQAFMPYFNLELSGAGIVGAIGWTGQWALEVRRNGPQLRIQSGQQLTHFRLHPDESVRTPRILLVAWKGPDRFRGHNLLRRLLLTHYVPRVNGEAVAALTVGGDAGDYNGIPEQMALNTIAKLAGKGLDAYERDAGWYVGGWPSAGSWTHDTVQYPRGLRPLSDAAHRNGMLFHLWFEPERASPESLIWKEHPQWLLKKQEAGWPDTHAEALFNLGNPDARAWMTDLLSKRITEYGVDIYRQDRNFHPQMYWRAADAKDRQGIAEIRHVEGHYALWDELLRRHPGLRIDNANWRCTGPDLEMTMRSMGSCSRCEWKDCGSDPISNQMGTVGASLYVPVHSNGAYKPRPYELRSTSVGGGGSGIWTAPEIAEAKLIRRLSQGDFYPLTPIDLSEESWCAWQFDRPELGEGIIVVIRRPKTPIDSFSLSPHTPDPTATYDVDFRETFDVRETRRMTGKELANIPITLANRPSSLLIHYKIAKNATE
jgi:alpha-galactosidase